MTSPFGPMLIVSNPAAGRGRDAVLPRLRASLDALGLAYEVALTTGPGDATEVARQAVEDRGLRYVVAVGGDGTVHEVVNGLVDPSSGRHRGSVRPVLGVVAGGSGCDFIRTFGLDRSPERVAAHLDGDALFPIDLGRVRYLDADGTERVRVFANIAEAGYGGLVTELANGLPRWLGQVRYVVAIAGAIRRFRLTHASVRVDHTEVAEPVSNVIVANGQFFGGGLKVAPRALPDDGTFNVQIWRGSALAVFKETPKLRVGEHLNSPDVREYQSATVGLETEAPLVLEADGEVLGTTPASFDVLPRVIDLKV